MNQTFSLNTDSVISANKTSDSSQSLKSRTDSKANESEAFSSELEKHLNKKGGSNLEAKSSSQDKKNPQEDRIAQNDDKRQTEELDSKNGKALPKEKDALSENAIVSEEVQQELFIDEILSQDQELGEDVVSNVDPEIVGSEDAETLDTETKQTILDELHAIGHRITADVDSPVKTKKLGKLVSSLVQDMPKHQNNSDMKNKTVLDKPQQGIEQSKEATNIRPDILQALSQRTTAKVENNKGTESVIPKMVIATEKVVANDKRVEGQLEITDIAKQIKSEMTVLGKPVLDKGASSFSSTLVSSIHSHVTNTPTTSTPVRSEAPLLDIQPEVQSKAWNRVLSSRVVWMAQEGIQQAALRLNPASLGSIDVKLSVQNEQVNISFIAQHATTRDALEQALPKLRESFGENGLELTDAEVSQQESFEQDDDNETDSDDLQANGDNVVTIEDGSDNEQEVIRVEQDDDQGLSLYA